LQGAGTSSIIVYEDVLITKIKILQDNQQKCGIYKWINKINGKAMWEVPLI